MVRWHLLRPSVLLLPWITGCATFLDDGFQVVGGASQPLGGSSVPSAGGGETIPEGPGTGSVAGGATAPRIAVDGGANPAAPSSGGSGAGVGRAGPDASTSAQTPAGRDAGAVGAASQGLPTGVVAYGAAEELHAAPWGRSGLGAEATFALGGRAAWVRAVLDPLEPGAALIGIQHHDESSGVVEVLRFTSAGLEPSAELTFGLPADDAGYQSFDVAFESDSGEAVAVYGRAEATPYFRVRGRDGEWGSEQALPESSDQTGIVRWVRLAPSSIDDRMVAMYSTDDRELFLVPWDGEQWRESDRLAAFLHTTSNVAGRSFDGTFSPDGTFVALWAPERDADATLLYSASSQWSEPTALDPWIDGSVSMVQTVAHPRDALVAGLMVDTSGTTSNVAAGTFSGQWTSTGFEDADVIDTDDAPLHGNTCAVAWVGDEAVALWPSDSEGHVGASWLRDSEWSAPELVTAVDGALTRSTRLAGSDEVAVALISAADGDGSYLVATTHGAEGAWSEPVVLTDELSSDESTAFDVVLPTFLE